MCAELRPSQPSTPMTSCSPSNAAGASMRHVATDSRNFLVMVDRHSGYLCDDELRSTNTAAVTKTLAKWFNTLGWPEMIWSDGGPQFLAEIDTFCKCHGVTHELSPAYSPQSNGLVEAAVKNAKQLFLKSRRNQTDYQHALYLWRNMLRTDGVSPAGRTPLQQTTDHQHAHDRRTSPKTSRPQSQSGTRNMNRTI